MARIRTIKPEFFTSEDIIELSPYARLLYIALWCEADREGRFYWKPKTFKIRYLPADAVEVDALCEELLSRNLVILYADGLAYIPSFDRHQHINPRESQSTLPPPKAQKARASDASSRVSDAQVGREGKEDIHASGFERFWEAYPRKTAKPDALKAWKKIDLDADLLERILKALSVACASTDWRRDGGQFIPYPATWLNGERWNDSPLTLVSPAAADWRQDPRFKGAK